MDLAHKVYEIIDNSHIDPDMREEIMEVIKNKIDKHESFKKDLNIFHDKICRGEIESCHGGYAYIHDRYRTNDEIDRDIENLKLLFTKFKSHYITLKDNKHNCVIHGIEENNYHASHDGTIGNFDEWEIMDEYFLGL